MLLDPDFVTELEDGSPFTDQSLDFVKKVMKALSYVDATPASAVITGQVKTGDGVNKAAITSVVARAVPSTATIAVNTGTVQAGGGTAACWLKTTAAGAFQITITGTGAVLIELTTDQGVPQFIELSL